MVSSSRISFYTFCPSFFCQLGCSWKFEHSLKVERHASCMTRENAAMMPWLLRIEGSSEFWIVKTSKNLPLLEVCVASRRVAIKSCGPPYYITKIMGDLSRDDTDRPLARGSLLLRFSSEWGAIYCLFMKDLTCFSTDAISVRRIHSTGLDIDFGPRDSEYYD